MPTGTPYKTEEERKEARKKSRDKYNKQYYLKNRSRCLEATRTYLRSHDGYAKEIYKKQRLANPSKRLLQRARRNAAERGFEFNLTIDDIIIPDHCPYLNYQLTYEHRSYSYASIDRIDSSKGYIRGNVQVISWLANCMKSDATVEQLVEFAKGVLRIHGGVDCNKISSECRELQQV